MQPLSSNSTPANSETPLVPFLKWAGGKRWLASSHRHLFPREFNTYIEPFLGGAAIFFSLSPKTAVLADANVSLIETYQAIKHDWKSVQSLLNDYQAKHSKDYYYEVRKQSFNSSAERAAQFIYLNRTCWNGLYRVNLSGQFNVPIGTKTNVLLDTDNFARTSAALSKSTLRAADFEQVIGEAKRGDFVFVDPPYTVKHNLNGFVKYNEKLFNWDDQIRLRDCVQKAASKGAKVMVTNADHEMVRDLYFGVGELISVDRFSVISGKSAARGKFAELIVRCF